MPTARPRLTARNDVSTVTSAPRNRNGRASMTCRTWKSMAMVAQVTALALRGEAPEDTHPAVRDGMAECGARGASGGRDQRIGLVSDRGRRDATGIGHGPTLLRSGRKVSRRRRLHGVAEP